MTTKAKKTGKLVNIQNCNITMTDSRADAALELAKAMKALAEALRVPSQSIGVNIEGDHIGEY